MSVQLEPRLETQPGVWAINAKTNIPMPPIAGEAYRTPISPAIYNLGQEYFRTVPANYYNEVLFLLSSLSRDSELFGFLRWGPNTNYVAGSNVTGTNGIPYRALQNSGPGTAVGAKEPTTNPAFWQTFREYIEMGSGGGSDNIGTYIPVGYIGLLPFRFANLPYGWQFCNGNRFLSTTTIGQALLALPAEYRTDWRIVESGGYVNVPDLINGQNGYFLRAVNGVNRLPGNIQQDGARQVSASATSTSTSTATGSTMTGGSGQFTGATNGGAENRFQPPTGIFSSVRTILYERSGDATSYNWCVIEMSLNNIRISAPTVTTRTTTNVSVSQANVAPENRPINIGMTPAIYLGA